MKRNFSGLILTLFLFTSCASGVQESIDNAQFALDAGDYPSAITHANNALTADSTSVEAAVLLATAYAGKAGLELTAIADDIADTIGTSGSNKDFSTLRTAFLSIFDSAEDLTNLRNGIVALTTTLTVAPASTHPLYKTYYFQLGFLRTLEAFVLPTLTAAPAGNATGVYDVSLLSSTHWNNVLSDFINGDDDMVKAGQTTGDLTETLRQNFCAIKAPTPGDDGTNGFTLAQLRDLVTCQLDSAASPTTTTVGACADFTFTACSGAGDTTN